MNRRGHTSPDSGKSFLVLTGLSLILIGSIFIWLMARSYLRAREMHAWPQVECTILSSQIAERRHDPHSPMEYSHQLSFGYQWRGQRFTSDTITLRGRKWSSKRQLAVQSHHAYPVGSSTRCHVNPAEPESAILKPDSLAPGYSIWFPALFVIGGAGMAARALRAR